MAAAKPGSHSLQLRPVEVPKCMLNGEKFIRWDEDIGTVTPVTLRVDEHGFFLYWTDPYDEVTLLDISSVRDTRTGKSAKIPKDPKLRHLVAAQDCLEDKTLTVYYGSDFVNLSFISFFSTDTEIAKYWSEELIKMAYNLLQPNCAAVMCLKKAYAKLQLTKDKKSGKIPVKNIVRMFTQHKDDRKRVAKALDLAGFPHGKNDAINPQKFHFDNFFNFYKNLTCRSEVEKIFEKEIDNPKKKLMTADQLVDFLNKTQRDPRLNEILYPYANTERAKDLIKQYEPNKYNAQKGQLSFDGFLCYLMSEDNPLVSPAKLDLSENMDQPLSHYFINSSHNTYLTGHQLTGKSSVEIYRQCLLAGCRCVELDLWNGRNGDPVIVHGYTLVPEIPAKEVIEAIGESAFKTSEYPVILSFENHCNPRQQAKLAQYCREIFGDTLLDIPLESHPLEPGVLLPSPSLLKRKIIIKNKKKVNRKMSLESNGSFEYSGEVQGNGDIARPFLGEKDKENTEGEELIEENTIDPEEYIDVLKLEDKVVVVPSKDESEAGAEISALVNYIQPVHFASFEESEAKRMHFEMSSFDEKEATMLLKERPIDFVNYNKHQLSRVYPSGTRFDSSNFMPQIFWNAGCQLVALNYQTMDLGMQLNLGIFEYNGRCGYLLKPEFMRREDKSFDPFAESIVDGIIAGTVLVKVISGQCLTDKRVGTYVEVDMYGLPADTVRKKFRTKVVPGNGMNPVYEGEAFLFKKVVLPELACLRFTAYEESGRFIGHRVLPVVGLCPGYRHITLRNEIGQPLAMATLFLSIEVKDYVPKDFSEIAEALVNPIKFQNELDKRHAQLKMLTDEVCDTNDDPREKDSAVEEQFMKKPTSPEPVGPSVVDDKKEAAPVTVEPSNATQEPSLTSRSSSVPARSSLIETAYQDIQAEPLDTFLECKEVKDKKMDLQKKLENLRKKHEKEKNNFCKVKVPKSSQEADKIKSLKFSVGHKLVKMSSSKNMHELPGSSGNVGRRLSCVTRSPSDDMMGQQAQEEKDLRLKYHEVVFNAASKSINSAQDTNLKVLKDEFEHKTSEVMDKLQVIRHNEIKALSKIHKDKDEMVRIKREVNTSMIEKGVKERLQLRKLYEKKKEELVGQYDEIRLQLEEEKMKSYELITKEYEQGKQLPSSNTAVDDSQMPSTSSGTAEDSQVPSVSSPATDDPQSPSSPNAAGDSAVQ